MELTNDFRVGVPIEVAWNVLADVERIAPCMPGAELQEVEGDVYRGIVKVKVGPIMTQYKGEATFVERDDETHRVVLRAEGRETRGQGGASATVTATLKPDGDMTGVSVVTELAITGRAAQFGRGVMADVSSKLLGQFVECLEAEVLGAERTPQAETSAMPYADRSDSGDFEAPTVRKVGSRGAEPIDLLDAVGSPRVKAAGLLVASLAVLWLLWRLFHRR